MEMPLTNLRKIVSLFSVSVLGLGYANAQDYTFTLKNSLSTERYNETVELEIPENANLTSLALFDEEGNNTPFHTSVNNKIVFQANIKAGSTTK